MIAEFCYVRNLRLFGQPKKELNNDLREFYSHSDEHPNGWGLALFDEQKIDYDNKK